MISVLRSASLVLRKDLLAEWRSRVVVGQILPFSIVLLLVFGFALDPDRQVLEAATPGLFWITVLLVSMIAAQRSAAIEAGDGATDGLRLSGLDPAGIFIGKTLAVVVQLVLLEVVLALGVTVLFGRELGGWLLLVTATGLATIAIAAAGTLGGTLTQGLAAGQTLLPVLVLPALVPVLLGATQAWEAALSGQDGGWGWAGMCGVVAVLALLLGAASYGSLLDEG